MTLIFKILIQLYWFFVPAFKRKHCIFKESCSNYVYNAIVEKGFLSGLRALRSRIQTCKPGYQIKINETNKLYEFHFANGKKANHEELCKEIEYSLLNQ